MIVCGVLSLLVLAGCGGEDEGGDPPPPEVCPNTRQSNIWLDNRLECLEDGQAFIEISSGATGRTRDMAYIIEQQAFDASFENLLGANQRRYFQYFLCVRQVPEGINLLSLATDLAVAIGTSNFSPKPPGIAASSLSVAGGDRPGSVATACDPTQHPVIVHYATGRIESVNLAALLAVDIYDL